MASIGCFSQEKPTAFEILDKIDQNMVLTQIKDKEAIKKRDWKISPGGMRRVRIIHDPAACSTWGHIGMAHHDGGIHKCVHMEM